MKKLTEISLVNHSLGEADVSFTTWRCHTSKTLMSGLQHKKPRIVWTNRPPRRPANGRHAMCDWPFPSTISCRLLMAPHRQKGRIVGQQFCPHKGMRIRTFCERRIAFRHSRPICELAKLEVPFLRSGDVYHCIRRIAF